jgi:hypothetical protein
MRVHVPKEQNIVLARLVTALLFMLAGLALLSAGSSGALAQTKEDNPHGPFADQEIPGTPLRIRVDDFTRASVFYTDPFLGLDNAQQFYSEDAEGVFLWLNVGGNTMVFGPPTTAAGNDVNGYTPVSNVLTGAGTPSNPWMITTVVSVPGTNVAVTRRTIYVNGAEFTRMEYTVAQIGGSGPITATLFHAADLYTGLSDSGYGYYDPETGGVGDYYTLTIGTRQRSFFQLFVPNTPASAYEESFYSTIWDAIGDTTGPGRNLNNTIEPANIDAGAALQWNLTVPAGGSVTVSDTDLFSLNEGLCGAFSDVRPSDFAYDHISYLACNGIVGGYADTTFRPNNPVTRGQLAKIVSNSAGFNEPVTGQTFEDVPPSDTFYVWIERLTSRGVMSGYACGGPSEPCVPPGNRPYFRPGANASRGQVSKIIANAANITDPVSGQVYADVPPSHTFYTEIMRLTGRGVMSGYPCGGPGEPCDPQSRPYFRPGNAVTRAQTSKIDANTFFPTCCP